MTLNSRVSNLGMEILEEAANGERRQWHLFNAGNNCHVERGTRCRSNHSGALPAPQHPEATRRGRQQPRQNS